MGASIFNVSARFVEKASVVCEALRRLALLDPWVRAQSPADAVKVFDFFCNGELRETRFGERNEQREFC